jgi:hypothetical protein
MVGAQRGAESPQSASNYDVIDEREFVRSGSSHQSSEFEILLMDFLASVDLRGVEGYPVFRI